jgi:hypothetical protein
VLVVLEAVIPVAGEQLGCFDPAILFVLEKVHSSWLIPGHPGPFWRADSQELLPQGDRSTKVLRRTRPHLTLEPGGRNY